MLQRSRGSRMLSVPGWPKRKSWLRRSRIDEDKMRVAVLGAGFQGVCVALELARRGIDVDLLDKNDRPITQAGWVNEGKIHLGFVYSNDPTMATAAMMVRGALHFRRLLSRWIDFDLALANQSSPFLYVVHRDSLLPPDRIQAYFERLTALVHETAGADGGDYLGAPIDKLFEPLPVSERHRLFSQKRAIAAYRTVERSVDPQALARLLRRAIRTSSRVAFHGATVVSGVVLQNGGARVDLLGGSQTSARNYEHVVNTLWAGRLAIDATVGRPPLRPWLHRFKYGIRLENFEHSIPSTTIILGPFGDTVQFSNGDVYMSWYPVCMDASSSDMQPPSRPRQPTETSARKMFDQTVEALSAICAAVGRLGRAGGVPQVRGATIVTWGNTDIDDPNSELHQRFQVGCFSDRHYHSVDTGKYTLAPMFASELADRICPLRG